MEGIGLEKEEGSREFEFEHTEAFSSFADAQSGNLVDWMHLVKIKVFTCSDRRVGLHRCLLKAPQ